MELPIFVSAQPSDLYYVWEVEVQINNFRKWGYSSRMQILVYDIDPEDPRRIEFRGYWERLQLKYPEVQIFFYPDKGVKKLLSMYIPVLRPHILAQHWEAHPELEKEAIFYHDADILFTRPLDFAPFLQDDICYLSDTNSYINASYFDSKLKDVLPEKLEKYQTVDILEQVTKIVGITREIAMAHDQVSGGAQYLLKNINADFWRKVQQDCISLRIHLMTVNKTFFPSEEKGFQSWCADMWAVLWNLWHQGKETQCPPELGFCWATSTVNQLDQYYIYHNAGVTGERKIVHNGADHPLFYKGDPVYKHNIYTPFDVSPQELQNISPEFCSHYYVQEILGIQDPAAKTSRVFMQ